jgi:hypothetical protein
MSDFGDVWIARDRDGRAAVLHSEQGGAVPVDALGSTSSAIHAALYDAWQEAIVPILATKRDHLAATFGGRFAVAFHDRARGAAALSDMPFHWAQSTSVSIDTAPRAVAIVDDVSEEVASRIVASDGYRGSICMDVYAFEEELAQCVFSYAHESTPGASMYRYRRRSTPELEMTIDMLPSDIAERVVRLDVTFRDYEVLDIALLLGTERCELPPSSSKRTELLRAAPVSGTRAWWSRLFAKLG